MTVFSGSRHLTDLTKIHAKYLNNTDFNGLKYSIDFTVAFNKSLHFYFYSYKKYHSLPGISQKVHIQQSSRKLNLMNMLPAEFTFGVTPIYLIQFITGQNCHDGCYK